MAKVIIHRKHSLTCLILLGLALLLSACTAAAMQPIPTQTQIILCTATQTRLPTATHIPLPTKTATIAPLPSPTAFAGLNAPRPWLILEQTDDDPLLVYPPDQSPILLSLPNGGVVHDIQKAVSPDGRWIAFFTGSHEGPQPDLTLNLLSLTDSSVRVITPVLANGFPENMRPVAEHMAQTATDLEDPPTVDGFMSILNRIFPQTVMATAWSPDSRSLAFSAQIDGPSADVYVYNLATTEIRRMVDDTDNTNWIDWSPDGETIVYSNAIPGPIYSAATLSVLQANGGKVHDPTDLINSNWWHTEGWIADNQLLIIWRGDGGDPFGINVLNTDTGELTVIQSGTYFAYAYDPDRQLFSVCAERSSESDEATVIIDQLFVRLDGSQTGASEPCFWVAEYVEWENARFVGRGPEGTVIIDSIGRMTPIFKGDPGWLSVSPDRKWVAQYNDKKIHIFSEPGKLVHSIETGTSTILWMPDSSGFWITADGNLYFTLPTGNPKQIDCPLNHCWIPEDNAVWVQ